jgi:hypothetical protein
VIACERHGASYQHSRLAFLRRLSIARDYASSRKQFGVAIESCLRCAIVIDMKIVLRRPCLLYETSRVVDTEIPCEMTGRYHPKIKKAKN